METPHEHSEACESSFDKDHLGHSGVGLDLSTDSADRIVAVWDSVTLVGANDHRDVVPVTNIRELFTGNGAPPDLSGEPPPEWMPFFMLLEGTILHFCDMDGRDATDDEMEKIFSELRRRPDGREGRLRSYIRAMASLYMKANPMSQAQYEAVMRRLTRSARTFSGGPTSTNYLRTLREALQAQEA